MGNNGFEIFSILIKHNIPLNILIFVNNCNQNDADTKRKRFRTSTPFTTANSSSESDDESYEIPLGPGLRAEEEQDLNVSSV